MKTMNQEEEITLHHLRNIAQDLWVRKNAKKTCPFKPEDKEWLKNQKEKMAAKKLHLQDIFERRKNGESLISIGNRYLVTTQTVRNWCSKAIALHSNGWLYQKNENIEPEKIDMKPEKEQKLEIVETFRAMNMEPPDWFSAKMLSPMVGFSRSSLYGLAAEGEIRSASFKKKGQVKAKRLFSYSSILKYIEKHASGGVDENP